MQIVRVTGLRGGNLLDVERTDGSRSLCVQRQRTNSVHLHTEGDIMFTSKSITRFLLESLGRSAEDASISLKIKAERRPIA